MAKDDKKDAFDPGHKTGRDRSSGQFVPAKSDRWVSKRLGVVRPGQHVKSVAAGTSKAGVLQLLRGETVTGSMATATEKMELAREGVGKKQLENLKDRAGLDYDDLADVLPATRATLLAKKGKEKFSPVVSEAIVSIADIYTYGYRVFGEEKRFNDWIKEPLQALGGATPFSLLDNQFGREEVRDLIGRIAYGVYS